MALILLIFIFALKPFLYISSLALAALCEFYCLLQNKYASEASHNAVLADLERNLGK
jgi:hypothetical protein